MIIMILRFIMTNEMIEEVRGVILLVVTITTMMMMIITMMMIEMT